MTKHRALPIITHGELCSPVCPYLGGVASRQAWCIVDRVLLSGIVTYGQLKLAPDGLHAFRSPLCVEQAGL